MYRSNNLKMFQKERISGKFSIVAFFFHFYYISSERNYNENAAGKLLTIIKQFAFVGAFRIMKFIWKGNQHCESVTST